jgi:PleD family two-component response regulator
MIPFCGSFAAVHLSTPTATVEGAPDGAEALRLLAAQPFDIAILDIDMPNLNGFELLENIRSTTATAHLPVIMLTSNEDIRSIDRAFMLGANSFLTKPVNWRLVSYNLKFVLRASRLERELRQDVANAQAGPSEQAAEPDG